MLADWFAAWTVLADFLGPESLVFSLLEGDSADGRYVFTYTPRSSRELKDPFFTQRRDPCTRYARSSS